MKRCKRCWLGDRIRFKDVVTKAKQNVFLLRVLRLLPSMEADDVGFYEVTAFS